MKEENILDRISIRCLKRCWYCALYSNVFHPNTMSQNEMFFSCRQRHYWRKITANKRRYTWSYYFNKFKVQYNSSSGVHLTRSSSIQYWYCTLCSNIFHSNTMRQNKMFSVVQKTWQSRKKKYSKWGKIFLIGLASDRI